ncbi:unnamed protein product [Adineta steineri]|uniref:Calponin-homology (CH) domain-containing protein n=2 Tax=Adineta steineri TaxID=433720 RepID=A0A818G2Q3_9BILA|nr:unnamed protein product [Adineta steineri]CAF0777506.1 unnamed protein product [Adineta steineri]CAF0792824.1 unnamed protein product [Adineta steineri]CAF0796976.1 unnamed protein product [Adineta steineri]CAF0840285.1 unnamed protein product [Adineta steineri]
MYWDIELDDQLLQDLYAWIDQIPFSRPKKHIEKDFSDGVMVAELVKHYFPSWVDIHNYATANNTQQKLTNWGLLNRKVLCRLDLNVPEPIMRGICLGRTGLVEIFLYNLRNQIDENLPQQQQQSKGNESNNMRTRQRQSSPPPSQHEKYPSGYSRNEPKNTPQGGHTAKKSTSMQNLSTDMVNRRHYDEKEQECQAKDQQIQVLQAKIQRLEELLRLKDVRVDDLSGKLNQTRGGQGGKSHPQQQTYISMNTRK